MSEDPEVRAEDDPAQGYAALPAWFVADVPEFYADTVNVNIGPYGMSLTFGIRGFEGPTPKARVFMSHEMALVTARLLRRILRSYELENNVKIQLPANVLTELKLRDEDFEALESTAGAADFLHDERDRRRAE